MKRHLRAILLAGVLVVAGSSFVGCGETAKAPEGQVEAPQSEVEQGEADKTPDVEVEDVPEVVVRKEIPAKPAPVFEADTPAGKHGQLYVDGSELKDENGEVVQLRGMSTHGIQWYSTFVNEGSFRTLRDEFGVEIIRMAMYTDDDSQYEWKKDELEQLMRIGIDLATELGMYVIVDWHILTDGNPNTHKDEAMRFFHEIASEYSEYPNVIYEICNEPNGEDVTWDEAIKPYAEEVIPVIRDQDPESVIIVGTPTWSQDIHMAAKNPLEHENLLYALHFYSNSHKDWLRERLVDCIDNDNLPVFVTEFGTCDASGGGEYNPEETDKWLDLLDSRNISWVNWSLSDKPEAASMFKAPASGRGNWTDEQLTDSGKYIKGRLLKTE